MYGLYREAVKESSKTQHDYWQKPNLLHLCGIASTKTGFDNNRTQQVTNVAQWQEEKFNRKIICKIPSPGLPYKEKGSR
jgi:hypothetical protein